MPGNQKMYEGLGSKFMDFDLMPPSVSEYLLCEQAFLTARIKPSDSLLDIGCGTGRYLELFAEKVSSMTGIDNAKQMVDISKAKIGAFSHIDVAHCSAENFNATNGQGYDVSLMAWNTICNIDKDTHVKTLENIHKLTHKALYISTWNIGEDVLEKRIQYYKNVGMDILEIKDNIVQFEDGFKGVAYTETYFADILEKVGFNIKFHSLNECGLMIECSK